MIIAKEKFVINSDTKNLGTVRSFVLGILGKHKGFKACENKIVLAVDEAVTNIIEHGYGKNGQGTIELEAECNSDSFKIVIRNDGKLFDPDQVPRVDLNDHFKQGKRRGLGIFLMRQIMDEIKYRCQNGVKNELTLIKYVDKS